MPDRNDADSVVRKLQNLREGLEPNEQQVLDSILVVFAEKVSQPEAQELLKDFPDAPELLDEVSGFAARGGGMGAVGSPGGGGEAQAITPTITTITLTTTLASHPWIGCVAGMSGAKPGQAGGAAGRAV